MAHLNISAQKKTYDAIVIGSGISGGWAAKELTEPTITFDASFKENERLMKQDMKNDAVEILEVSGCTNVKLHDNNATLGGSIHEMGTARMGKDPSVTKTFLQSWI